MISPFRSSHNLENAILVFFTDFPFIKDLNSFALPDTPRSALPMCYTRVKQA